MLLSQVAAAHKDESPLTLVCRHILYSTAVGIGVFLAFIGLQNENGVGLVTGDTATLVSLGGEGAWIASAECVWCPALLLQRE